MKEDRGNLTVPDRRSGESPSGKAAAFGAAIRRFESSLPSQRQRAGASVGQASFRICATRLRRREPRFEYRPILPSHPVPYKCHPKDFS